MGCSRHVSPSECQVLITDETDLLPAFLVPIVFGRQSGGGVGQGGAETTLKQLPHGPDKAPTSAY